MDSASTHRRITAHCRKADRKRASIPEREDAALPHGVRYPGARKVSFGPASGVPSAPLGSADDPIPISTEEHRETIFRRQTPFGPDAEREPPFDVGLGVAVVHESVFGVERDLATALPSLWCNRGPLGGMAAVPLGSVSLAIVAPPWAPDGQLDLRGTSSASSPPSRPFDGTPAAATAANEADAARGGPFRHDGNQCDDEGDGDDARMLRSARRFCQDPLTAYGRFRRESREAYQEHVLGTLARALFGVVSGGGLVCYSVETRIGTGLAACEVTSPREGIIVRAFASAGFSHSPALGRTSWCTALGHGRPGHSLAAATCPRRGGTLFLFRKGPPIGKADRSTGGGGGSGWRAPTEKCLPVYLPHVEPSLLDGDARGRDSPGTDRILCGLVSPPADLGDARIAESVRSSALPLSLAHTVIEHLSEPGDLVLDPFAATGNVALACGLAARRFVAIEADPICETLFRRRWSVFACRGAFDAALRLVRPHWRPPFSRQPRNTGTTRDVDDDGCDEGPTRRKRKKLDKRPLALPCDGGSRVADRHHGRLHTLRESLWPQDAVRESSSLSSLHQNLRRRRSHLAKEENRLCPRTAFSDSVGCQTPWPWHTTHARDRQEPLSRRPPSPDHPRGLLRQGGGFDDVYGDGYDRFEDSPSISRHHHVHRNTINNWNDYQDDDDDDYDYDCEEDYSFGLGGCEVENAIQALWRDCS